MASLLRSAALNTAAAPAPVRALPDPAVRAQTATPLHPLVQHAPRVELSQPCARPWWAAVIPHWLRRHRLAAPDPVRHGAMFTTSAGLQQRLVDQFDLRQDARATAYLLLQAQSVIVQLQARVLADLGVNRRNLRHLRHQTRLPQGARALGDAHQQRLDCQLVRVVRVSPHEVMALLQTRIVGDDGEPLALLEDGFVVTQLSSSDTARVDDDDLLRRAVSRDRCREPAIDPAAGAVLRRQLFLAGHTRRAFPGGRPRWPGRGHPVVQELYLRNLVARELAEWGIEPASLQITFCAQARIGQTLCLRLQGRAFELVGPEGQLMAFGHAA